MKNLTDYLFRGRNSWLVPLLLLTITIVIFELTNWDMELQSHFFVPGHGWLLHLNKHKGFGLVYYTIPNLLLGNIGFVILAYSLWRLFLRHRICWNGLYVMLCMIVIPTFVANIKAQNSMPYPSKTVEFGGRETKRSLIESFRAHNVPGLKQYHGWPAGHASGGCSLVCLAFIPRKRCLRWLGFGTAILFGGFTGFCHTIDGAHFFSHLLVTFFLAWLVSAWLFLLQRNFRWLACTRKRRSGTNVYA